MSSYIFCNSSSRDSAYLPLLSEEDVRSILFRFKKNKSRGYDQIKLDDLGRHSNVLRKVLLFIFHSFIESRIIQWDLKVAIVKPFHNGGERSDITNYRPVSILPSLSPILGRHLEYNDHNDQEVDLFSR